MRPALGFAVTLSVSSAALHTQVRAEAKQDAGCDNDAMPERVAAPAEFAPFVVACLSPDGYMLEVKNVSAGVLRLTPAGITTWSDYERPTNFAHKAVSAVVGGGQVRTPSITSPFDLRRDERVTATSYGEPVLVYLDFLVRPSAESYVARFVANWVEAQFKGILPAGLRLGLAFTECVNEVADALRETAIWEDAVRTAVKTVESCGSFAQSILSQVDEYRNISARRALNQLANQLDGMADDAARARWSYRTGLDDLMRYAALARKLFS